MALFNQVNGLARRGWKLINSNIVSGLAAAAIGHLLTKSYRDNEITELTSENDDLHKRNGWFSISTESTDTVNQSLQVLLVERNHQLHTCQWHTSRILSDFDQSYCLWRSRHYRDLLVDATNIKASDSPHAAVLFKPKER